MVYQLTLCVTIPVP